VNIQVEVLDGVMVSQFVQSGGDCGVRRPPDNLVEDPQVCAGGRDCTGHYAAFAATGAILPTTSVLCSSA
jgi:hypothetical protein